MNPQMAIDTVATLPSGRRLAECNHESRWRKQREAVHNVFMHAPDVAMEGPLTYQIKCLTSNSIMPNPVGATAITREPVRRCIMNCSVQKIH